MIFTNLLILGYLGCIVFLIFITIYTYYLYKQERDLRNRQNELYQKAIQIIKHSHQKAEHIVQKAADNAKGILLHTKTFKKELEKEVEENLHKAIDSYISVLERDSKEIRHSYEKLFAELKSHFTGEEQAMFTKLEKEGERGVGEFRATLSHEIIESDNQIRHKIQEEYAGAKQEIDLFKQEQLTIAQKQVEKLIGEVATEVLGKTLPLHDHQKLIVEALETAKREGVFS